MVMQTTQETNKLQVNVACWETKTQAALIKAPLVKSPQDLHSPPLWIQLRTPGQHSHVPGMKPLYWDSHGSQAVKKYSTPHCTAWGTLFYCASIGHLWLILR